MAVAGYAGVVEHKVLLTYERSNKHIQCSRLKNWNLYKLRLSNLWRNSFMKILGFIGGNKKEIPIILWLVNESYLFNIRIIENCLWDWCIFWLEQRAQKLFWKKGFIFYFCIKNKTFNQNCGKNWMLLDLKRHEKQWFNENFRWKLYGLSGQTQSQKIKKSER